MKAEYYENRIAELEGEIRILKNVVKEYDSESKNIKSDLSFSEDTVKGLQYISAEIVKQRDLFKNALIEISNKSSSHSYITLQRMASEALSYISPNN